MRHQVTYCIGVQPLVLRKLSAKAVRDCRLTRANYVIGAQQGILAECRKQGFELIIYPCDAKAENLCDELSEMVTRSGVGGLVITPPVSEIPDVVAALRALDIKFVRILSGSEAPDDLSPCVFVDDREAAQDITTHLVELGHQHIAFLCGDEEHRSNSERLAGYKDALSRHGIPVNADLVIDGKFSFESGVDRTKELLARAERPSAIFACNDEIAAGALFAARMMGLDVPQEVSIAGFEDNPFSRQTWPKLTTARQSTEAIAQSAAQLLIAAIRPAEGQGQEETRQQAVGFHPELVVRDSTCCPNSLLSHTGS